VVSRDIPTAKCTAPEESPYECVAIDASDTPYVAIETDFGTMVFELWPDVAYIHCQSFIYLTESGFYDSLTIHRVVPGFVIQGGDPNGNGTGGPSYTLPLETSNRPHIEGTLSMARAQDPNSAGSQFFICLSRLPALDGRYTVFGHLKDGYDVLHAIEHVSVTNERPDNPVYIKRMYLLHESEQLRLTLGRCGKGKTVEQEPIREG
jgi:peptidyl-prolyl cis-trans isomerase B (cyclophilin B)